MIFRATLIWVLLLGFAVLNGTVREFVLAPRMGAQAAHVASTLILCAAIFVVALLFTRWIAPKSRGGALLIGSVWLALTLAFEFLAGHYLFGSSWQRLSPNTTAARPGVDLCRPRPVRAYVGSWME
jgi:membrane-anchored protein YejM (alkaline phosphatase superfamily)